MANRIFQRYNSLLNEATSLEQYYSKSYITGLQQTFINLQPNQYWMYDGISKTIRLPHQIFHAILTLPCPT